MSRKLVPQPEPRPPRFLPPEVDAKVNENLLRFAANFESFRVKNTDYISSIRNKASAAALPPEPIKGQSERPPKMEVRGSQKMSVNSPPQPSIPARPNFEPVNNFNPRSVVPNPFEKSVAPLPPTPLKSVHGVNIGSSQGIVSVPVPAPHPIISHQPCPLQLPPAPPAQAQPLPSSSRAYPHLTSNLREMTVTPNGPFDPHELFLQFDAQYRGSVPIDTHLPASFARCPPNRKARIFSQIGQLASEITDPQIEPFLFFVSAFENDFLLLSALSRLLKRPGLSLSQHWVGELGAKLARLHRSRRVQLLLINFINKLD